MLSIQFHKSYEYLLISFISESFNGFQMLFCYLIVYIGSGAMYLVCFHVFTFKKTNEKKQNRDLAYFVLLAKSNKMLAIILMTALFSIGGISFPWLAF